MYRIVPIEPVDYLIIGHITEDITPTGSQIGGTASYSALTAKALGLRVGIVTACNNCLNLEELNRIPVAGLTSEDNTVFENIQTPAGRVQYLHHRAPTLNLSLVPESWRNPSIVHLAPVANEVDPGLVRAFPNALIGLTPQGWMRAWDEQGLVRFTDWPEAGFVMQNASAAVLSIEDVHGDESYIEDFASHIRVLAVTEGAAGARVYWNGDVRRFRPPSVEELEPTGAGDIFAASFFYRLGATRDPWEAGRFATHLASFSVTRRGMGSIPNADEIQMAMTEII